MNACIWLARTNTQNLHTILYVFCLKQWLVQCCADKPTWGCIPQLFATFEPWRRHLRRVTSAKGSQKSEYYMLAFDWLEQTDKIGCNSFPARMTCAELWCQIVWEHFPQLCVKFQPWRRQLGNLFMTTPYLYNGFFKCTILLHICTISFSSYYDVGCTMFR